MNSPPSFSEAQRQLMVYILVHIYTSLWTCSKVPIAKSNYTYSSHASSLVTSAVAIETLL